MVQKKCKNICIKSFGVINIIVVFESGIGVLAVYILEFTTVLLSNYKMLQKRKSTF